MIVEREGELRELARAIAEAAAGRGATLAITGPAGIGKTVLIEDGIGAARDLGMRILTARPTLLERELGFGVVRELFADEVLDVSDEVRDRRLSAGARLASAALGVGVAGAAPGDDPLSTALTGLHRLCVNIAREVPLVLVIDDAQWADPPSLRFLAYLSRRLDDQPILLLVGVRSGEAADGYGSLEELVDGGAARVLCPAELSEDGVRAIVEESFPRAEPAFVRACARSSGANPFYLGELLRAARHESLDATAAAAARVEELSTEELRRAVLARLTALGGGAHTLAEAVATFPGAVHVRQVAEISGLNQDAAARAADALRDAGILAEADELDFRHPIIRAVVHERIPAARRGALHRAAADALMREHGPAEHIVFHLLQTDPANDAASAKMLGDAARSAIAAGAFHEAIAYANRALAEPPVPHERAERLRDIGVAEVHLGMPEALDRLRDAADAAPTPRLRAEILRQLGAALLTSGRFVGVEHVLDEATSSLGAEDRSLALEIEADLVAAAQMAMLPAELIGARLARHPEGELLGHTHGERCLLGVAAFEAVRRNDPASTGLRLARRALPDGGAPVDISHTFPLYLGTLALIYLEAYDDALLRLDDGLRRLHAPRSVAVHEILRACARWALGELRRAVDACERGLATEGFHSQTTAPITTTWLAQAKLDAGQVDEAEVHLQSLGLLTAAPEDVPFEQPLYARAQLHLERGRPTEALADMQACGAKLADRGSFSPAVIPWRSGAAVACAALGHDAEARRWADEELRLARRFGAPRCLGIALRVAGQVAPPAERLPLLREAVTTLERSPARLERARALLELGAALRRNRKRTQAREPLTHALELGRQCGAALLVERAREELLAAGARPRRHALSGIEALTAGERRVIRLAAEGRSNREIAGELVVTLKTVEMHLRNAYGKLDVRSRRDIDDELRETLRSL